jgi:hypothetical protein
MSGALLRHPVTPNVVAIDMTVKNKREDISLLLNMTVTLREVR